MSGKERKRMVVLGCDLKCRSNGLGQAGVLNLEEVLAPSPGLPVRGLPWVKIFMVFNLEEVVASAGRRALLALGDTTSSRLAGLRAWLPR